MNSELFDAIVELREKDVLRIVKEKIACGEDPLAIVECCREAVSVVGDRFAKNEYFLSELFMAAEIFKEAMAILEPEIHKRTSFEKKIGKVVVGTVSGDVHDVGKNIVISMLSANGFDVYDLGVDVPSEEFVKKIREVNPEIVAMSGLVTISWDSMKQTVEAIKEAGLRDKIKIIIGGGTINEEIAKYVGADAFATLNDGIKLCKKWVGA